ncbi:hypothetical protein [Lentzea sp. NPDC060358]|uniref:hypothetical protein n=1 Tax=Lentzea sp. NPDC060358 TaxID=3347103 RepID=UPI003668AE0E
MKHSDQSTENDLGGDVSGTAFQAGSIEINVGTPGRRWQRKALRWLSVPAVAAVLGGSASVVDLVSSDDQVLQLPATPTSGPAPDPAVPTTPPPPHTTTAPAPARVTVRPTTQQGSVARPAGTTTPPPPPVTTTTEASLSPAAAPPVVGVRYSGSLRFGSYHLDPRQPRDNAGTNVWPLTPGRLHGDPGYRLAEWFADGLPGQAECLAHLSANSTQDAENLVAGSRVCGMTPHGRVFRIEVAVVDPQTIEGHVTVWELD